MLERLKGYLIRQDKRPTPTDLLTNIDVRLLLSQDYWLEQPKKHPAVAEALQASGRCDLWAEEAGKALEADGYKGVFLKKWKGDMGVKKWLWDTHYVWQHQYIELHCEEGRRYIADGTAGQFFDSGSDYHNGYFGFVDEAPPVLQAIYNYNE